MRAAARGRLSEPDDQTVLGPPGVSARTGPRPSPVLSLVPGIQNPPLGLYDTALALGLVGSAVGTVQGVQASGVFNFASGSVNGFQWSGVFNMAAGNINGFQGAGVFNLARGVDGFQGAGVFNISERVDGFQGAGVFNIAKQVDGFQMSGVFNIADTVDGGMISPVFNAAEKVSGVMIGLVNVADELDGVALGLVNIIGNGINEIGLEYVPAEDMTYLSYRTGTRSLYSVYYGGVGSEDWFVDSDSLIAGFGYGYRFQIGEGSIDFEVRAEQEFYPDRRTALAAASKSGDESAFFALIRPYPSVRAALNVPVLGVKAVLGLEADFDVPAWASSVPERLRKSSFQTGGWSGSAWGLEFTAWPKVYIGLSF